MGERAKEGVPPLLEVAKDPDDQVRSLAIVALGMIGPGHQDVLPCLLEAMQDKSSLVRVAAAASFLRFDYNDRVKIIPVLVEAASNDKVPTVRQAALEMLNSIDPAAASKVPVKK